MEYLVFAEVEIDGNRIEHFSNVFLKQEFNAHHEFTIQLDHDSLETEGSFSLENSKDLIGKSAIIKFFQRTDITQKAYEFLGIIYEVGFSQSLSTSGDLVIKGYSPTILLEDGPRLSSYNEKTLSTIVDKIMQPGLSKVDCTTSISPNFTSPVKYISQYKESTFHFINRLSSDYGELFYYDGKSVIFGNQPEMTFVEVSYGEDMSNLQLNLHVEPIEAWKFGYASGDNSFVTSRGTELSDLDAYAQHVVNISNDLYSDPDDLPLLQRVESVNDLENFVTKSKEATAAKLVVLSGSTNNPNLFIGCVADVKISKKDGNGFAKEDYGVYLVTSITHHVTGNGKYYNSFEALSGWVKGIPVKNAVMPSAEPQYAWVVDNKDPDKMGRVRVQMLWQKDDEKSDWIWVMTPDAGGGKDGARGGGMMVLPEEGDRVLIGFVYNNPDRPFVYGSFHHGQSAPDGAMRALKGRRSEALVQIDDAIGSVLIGDGGDSIIYLNGSDNIHIETTAMIKLKVGSSEILIEPAKITIQADDIKINATKTVDVQGSTKAVIKKDDNTYFKAEGTAVTIEGMTADVKGNNKATVGGTQVEVNGTAQTEVKGGMVKINP